MNYTTCTIFITALRILLFVPALALNLLGVAVYYLVDATLGNNLHLMARTMVNKNKLANRLLIPLTTKITISHLERLGINVRHYIWASNNLMESCEIYDKFRNPLTHELGYVRIIARSIRDQQNSRESRMALLNRKSKFYTGLNKELDELKLYELELEFIDLYNSLGGSGVTEMGRA